MIWAVFELTFALFDFVEDLLRSLFFIHIYVYHIEQKALQPSAVPLPLPSLEGVPDHLHTDILRIVELDVVVGEHRVEHQANTIEVVVVVAQVGVVLEIWLV